MRYIAIDNHSGFIWFDVDAASPEAACAEFDASIGGRPETCEYEAHGPGYHPASNEAAYFVYEAAADFPPVGDGQDRAEIEAVEGRCKLVAVVTVCEVDL